MREKSYKNILSELELIYLRTHIFKRGSFSNIESISEEQAHKYQAALYEYEQNVLNGLDDKIAKRMKELYPEN